MTREAADVTLLLFADKAEIEPMVEVGHGMHVHLSHRA